MRRKQTAVWTVALAVGLVFFVNGCAVETEVGEAATQALTPAPTLAPDIFRIEWYEEMIDWFVKDEPLEKEIYVGEINSIESARQGAQILFLEVFDEEGIREQMPFKVEYDEISDTWHIVGDKEWGEEELGGLAHAIIRGEDGKVLAYWHGE